MVAQSNQTILYRLRIIILVLASLLSMAAGIAMILDQPVDIREKCSGTMVKIPDSSFAYICKQ